MGPMPSGEAHKSCPFCAEQILAAAIKCKHCGEFLERTPRSTASSVNDAVTGAAVVQTQMLCERYELLREIGRGGMAVVYEGIHPTLERAVAIKMLSHELVHHRHFADRFRNEAKIIANLHHPNIVEVCQAVHQAGGLVYGDGANMNALLGRAKLGDLGFDVCHLNLHKTFSTPHGGGGPGAGPVCAGPTLRDYLPSPVVAKGDDGLGYALSEPPRTIGRMGGFHGNFGVLVRAYTYIRTLGADGIKAISGNAVLNANYLMEALKDTYHLPYDRVCMHEAVFSADWQKARGVSGLEIAKRLLDYGFHAPTMYFPLIVHEALMIEPTESETRQTLDLFIEALKQIDAEITSDPEMVRQAPHSTPVARLDEALAARQPDLRWKPQD